MAEQEQRSFTPTEQRILRLLSDGLPHTREELVACLWDEENIKPLFAMRMHVSKIRKKIRPRGEDLICELKGYVISYRHVRLLASPYRE